MKAARVRWHRNMMRRDSDGLGDVFQLDDDIALLAADPSLLPDKHAADLWAAAMWGGVASVAVPGEEPAVGPGGAAPDEQPADGGRVKRLLQLVAAQAQVRARITHWGTHWTR